MNRDKAQAVVDELEAVCRKHGVILVGTCAHEGIYGEITIHERGDKEAWDRMETRPQAFCVSSDGDFEVSTIGNEPVQG